MRSPTPPFRFFPRSPLARGLLAGAVSGCVAGLWLLAQVAPPDQPAQWMGDPTARLEIRRAAAFTLALTGLTAAVTGTLFFLIAQARGWLARRTPPAAKAPRRPAGVPHDRTAGPPRPRNRSIYPTPLVPGQPPARPALQTRDRALPASAASPVVPAASAEPEPVPQPIDAPDAEPTAPQPGGSRAPAKTLRSLIRTSAEVLAEGQSAEPKPGGTEPSSPQPGRRE